MFEAIKSFFTVHALKIAGVALVLLGSLCLWLAWTKRDVEARLDQSLAVIRLNTERIRSATASFRAAHTARVLEIERKQDQISQESDRDYQNRIDDLRRRVAALQLRASAGADPGGAGRAGNAAPLPGAAGEPDAPAAQAGLPAEDAIIATEQAIQLDELQRWVQRQLEVER